MLYFSRIGLSRSISSREAFSPAAGAPAWCWGFVLALGIAVRTRCGFVDALGIAFGGVRVLTKRFFPGKVFDRPEDMEVLQLGLSGKRIDPRDFY